MQVSTHDLITPAANKQHKIEDQLPEYFNHGRILAPLAGIIPDLSFNLVGHHGGGVVLCNVKPVQLNFDKVGSNGLGAFGSCPIPDVNFLFIFIFF